MAGLPTVQVLLDDGTGTFPYDITAFARMVEGYSFKRGRQDELSSPTPGDFTLVLDNTDGRFTVGSTIIASPSPIKMDQLIRVKLTANATTVNRFTQAVQSWPVEWPTGGEEFAVASISGTDAQAQAEGWKLRSIIQEEVGEDSPSVHYTLGDPEGATSAGDSSGNQGPSLVMAGTGTDVVFGTATGPTTDGLTAAQFAAGKYLTAALSVTASALRFAFATTDATSIRTGLRLISTSGVIRDACTMSGGHVFVGGVDCGAVNDGLNHDVLWSGSSIYLDGVLKGAGVDLTGTAVAQIEVGGSHDGGIDPFIGSIAHVALFASAPSGARAAAQATAVLTGFAGESGTARITRLAGYANLPIGTLDASLTDVAFEDITGKSVMEAIQQVADAEMGVVFFDGSGNLTFHNRNRVLTKTTPDVTIDANFLAESTQFEYDMQGVINYFEVTAVGTKVTQLVQDSTSIVKHGKYDGSKSFLVQTDAEALDRANWIVAAHKEPTTRIGSLVIDAGTMTAAQQASMLGVEPSTWLRVTGLPSQMPGGATADFIVQGIADVLDAEGWTLTLNAANKAVAAPSVWILGQSALGSDTRLGV